MSCHLHLSPLPVCSCPTPPLPLKYAASPLARNLPAPIARRCAQGTRQLSGDSGNGQFASGHGGVAFDNEGNLVVADFGNHRVQVLRYSDGAHVRTIGSAGSDSGQFKCPSGVAFDAAGHIVVVEYSNHRVQVLRYSDGAHVCTFGSLGSDNGQFSNPRGGIAIDSDGRIVVADSSNNRVQVLE